jgi:uncharacterized protein with beta-barrel porin domain
MPGAASWSFSENDFKQIQQHLQAFLRDSNARCALLVDRTGQLVATVGETPQFDSAAFASLTAAYQFRWDGLMLSPYGRINAAWVTLNAFTESGGLGGALAYSSQTAEFYTAVLGLRASTRSRPNGARSRRASASSTTTTSPVRARSSCNMPTC